MRAQLLLAASLAAALGVAPAIAGDVGGMPAPRADGWLAASPKEIASTASTAATRADIASLKAIVAKRTPEDIARHQWWSVGGPVYRWNEILLQEIQDSFVTLPMAARHLALAHAAMDDAVAAAGHGKKARGRAGTAIDSALVTPGPAGARQAMASEHAAAAVAASEVIGHLFPARAQVIAAKAEEAIEARLAAGVELPIDIAAGREIGRKAAALAIARGKADGSDAKWSGSVPEGPGKWRGTNPIAPAAATWRPWVLSRADEMRPAAPPAYDSEQVKSALAELKSFQRTPPTNHRATFWEVNGGARAHTLWNEIARTKLLEYGASAATSARVLAALNIALVDAGIACWDAKYAYWYARPPHLDAELKTLFAPPNHPSYPAAHGCFSTAAATVLAIAFPRDRDMLLGLGKEAADARMWAGIHYRFDIDAGQALGRKVAEKVVERAFAAGSQ